MHEYFRPSFWPNTPDILPEHLQLGTRATFIARAVLAATLSPSWGIYGPPFELQEQKARPGAEEYAGNEKYQLRSWDLSSPHSLKPVLRRLNHIRRDNPALQRLEGTVFHETDNDLLICYSRRSELDGQSSTLLVVVNLDPHNRHSGWLSLDLNALGLSRRSRIPGPRSDERCTLPLERLARLRDPGPRCHAGARLSRAAACPQRTELRVLPVNDVNDTWTALLEPAARPRLARLLLEYVLPRRWFRAKSRTPRGAEIADLIPFDGHERRQWRWRARGQLAGLAGHRL